MFIKSRIGWQALTKKEYLETGDYYLITGTDIDEDKHIVDFNCCYYVSKERYEMDDKIQVYEGDIIVTKDGTIGKVAMVTGLDKPATLNSHLFVLRDLSGKLYNRFLLQVLVSHIFGDFVESTKTGSTLTGLPQKTFVEFRFLMPEMDEQMKIAQYLDNLDNLITLHQRKYDKLQNIKKSMLEKMFPKNGSNVPEIRFSGFTDPWEQRKLGDVIDFLDTLRKPLKETDREPGPYPYYGASGIVDHVADYIFDEELILLSEDGANITDRNYPVCFLATGKYWVNNHAHVLKARNKMDNNFICMSMERKDYSNYNTGMAMPKLNKDTCCQIPVDCPTFEEQKKIGDYFRNLDNLITLHQRELEKLQYIKKSMLEKMFV